MWCVPKGELPSMRQAQQGPDVCFARTSCGQVNHRQGPFPNPYPLPNHTRVTALGAAPRLRRTRCGVCQGRSAFNAPTPPLCQCYDGYYSTSRASDQSRGRGGRRRHWLAVRASLPGSWTDAAPIERSVGTKLTTQSGHDAAVQCGMSPDFLVEKD